MTLKDSIIQRLMPIYEKIKFDQKDYFDNVALEYFVNCKKIVDLGCGEGRFLAKDPAKISGIDQNQQSIKICLQKNLRAQVGQVTKTTLKDSSVDGVHCSHVIEHLLPDAAYSLLKEINRILKKGGIVIIRTPLLSNKFYGDLTHIKPYYPPAIMHYLKTDKQNQRTLDGINCQYEKIKLIYRRAELFADIDKDSFWFFLVPLFNLLYRCGITSHKKTGYMLVLKKLN